MPRGERHQPSHVMRAAEENNRDEALAPKEKPFSLPTKPGRAPRNRHRREIYEGRGGLDAEPDLQTSATNVGIEVMLLPIEGERFLASCALFPGVATTGRTRKEAADNLMDVLDAHVTSIPTTMLHVRINVPPMSREQKKEVIREVKNVAYKMFVRGRCSAAVAVRMSGLSCRDFIDLLRARDTGARARRNAASRRGSPA